MKITIGTIASTVHKFDQLSLVTRAVPCKKNAESFTIRINNSVSGKGKSILIRGGSIEDDYLEDVCNSLMLDRKKATELFMELYKQEQWLAVNLHKIIDADPKDLNDPMLTSNVGTQEMDELARVRTLKIKAGELMETLIAKEKADKL